MDSSDKVQVLDDRHVTGSKSAPLVTLGVVLIFAGVVLYGDWGATADGATPTRSPPPTTAVILPEEQVSAEPTSVPARVTAVDDVPGPRALECDLIYTPAEGLPDHAELGFRLGGNGHGDLDVVEFSDLLVQIVYQHLPGRRAEVYANVFERDSDTDSTGIQTSRAVDLVGIEVGDVVLRIASTHSASGSMVGATCHVV